MKRVTFILLLILIFGKGYSQQAFLNHYDINSNKENFSFWRLTGVSGEIFVKGHKRTMNIVRGSFIELQKSTIYTAGLLLNTKSYIWNPNFLQIEAGGELNLGTNNDNYIIIPDRAEVRTLNRLELRGLFFNSKPITLVTFLNLGNIYQNRENLNNIHSKSKSWGGFFNYKNKILPHNISYTRTQTRQDELNSIRDFYFDQTLFEARTSRSFTKYEDNNELIYSFNDYKTTQWQSNSTSRFQQLQLKDNIYFDYKKNVHLLSLISNDKREGTYNSQKRFRIFETLFLKLPKKMEYVGVYEYNNELYDSIRLKHNYISGMLRHQLYESLNTRIIYEYNRNNYSNRNEIQTKAGFGIRYTKKIPLKGRLNINYNFTRQHYSTNSEDVILFINREEHLLTDGTIVLLNKAFINQPTIIITDVTNSLIYQEGFDYIIILRNNYIEIQRIPGGLIPNNSTVYVSYSANQPGSYKYNANVHYFNTSIYLFQNLFEVYYRLLKQDYYNLEKTEYITLNFINQNIIGTKINYQFVSGGVEYNYYKSSIVPYKLMKYYLDIHKNFNNKIFTNLNFNLYDYIMIEDSVRNKLFDASFKISYLIKSTTTLSVFGSYYKQDYNKILMNLILAGAELTSVYKKLYFTLGVEFYYRNYSIEEYKMKGIYIQLTRKF